MATGGEPEAPTLAGVVQTSEMGGPGTTVIEEQAPLSTVIDVEAVRPVPAMVMSSPPPVDPTGGDGEIEVMVAWMETAQEEEHVAGTELTVRENGVDAETPIDVRSESKEQRMAEAETADAVQPTDGPEPKEMETGPEPKPSPVISKVVDPVMATWEVKESTTGMMVTVVGADPEKVAAIPPDVTEMGAPVFPVVKGRVVTMSSVLEEAPTLTDWRSESIKTEDVAGSKPVPVRVRGVLPVASRPAPKGEMEETSAALYSKKQGGEGAEGVVNPQKGSEERLDWVTTTSTEPREPREGMSQMRSGEEKTRDEQAWPPTETVEEDVNPPPETVRRAVPEGRAVPAVEPETGEKEVMAGWTAMLLVQEEVQEAVMLSTLRTSGDEVVTAEGGEESVQERKAEESGGTMEHGWPPMVTTGAMALRWSVPNPAPTMSMVVADGRMEMERVWPDTTGAMGIVQGLGEQGVAWTDPEVTATAAADWACGAAMVVHTTWVAVTESTGQKVPSTVTKRPEGWKVEPTIVIWEPPEAGAGFPPGVDTEEREAAT